jgi:hypothetical protein
LPPPPKVEDLQRIREHLAEMGGAPTCPVCQTKSWLLTGPVSLPVAFHGVLGALGAVDTMPMMLLVCQKCSYVLQFAWGRILAVGEDE